MLVKKCSYYNFYILLATSLEKLGEYILQLNIQAYLVFLLFALLSFTDVVFLQVEGKTVHQQKDYQTCFNSEVCLYAFLMTQPYHS